MKCIFQSGCTERNVCNFVLQIFNIIAPAFIVLCRHTWRHDGRKTRRDHSSWSEEAYCPTRTILYFILLSMCYRVDRFTSISLLSSYIPVTALTFKMKDFLPSSSIKLAYIRSFIMFPYSIRIGWGVIRWQALWLYLYLTDLLLLKNNSRQLYSHWPIVKLLKNNSLMYINHIIYMDIWIILCGENLVKGNCYKIWEICNILGY